MFCRLPGKLLGAVHEADSKVGNVMEGGGFGGEGIPSDGTTCDSGVADKVFYKVHWGVRECVDGEHRGTC